MNAEVCNLFRFHGDLLRLKTFWISTVQEYAGLIRADGGVVDSLRLNLGLVEIWKKLFQLLIWQGMHKGDNIWGV